VSTKKTGGKEKKGRLRGKERGDEEGRFGSRRRVYQKKNVKGRKEPEVKTKNRRKGIRFQALDAPAFLRCDEKKPKGLGCKRKQKRNDGKDQTLPVSDAKKGLTAKRRPTLTGA